MCDRSGLVFEFVTPPPVGWQSFDINAAAVSKGHPSFLNKQNNQKNNSRTRTTLTNGFYFT